MAKLQANKFFADTVYNLHYLPTSSVDVSPLMCDKHVWQTYVSY